MLLECINTSVWNLFIIPEEDWSQSKSIEKYEVNKLKNEDGYSCFYAFVQLPGHSSKTAFRLSKPAHSVILIKQSPGFVPTIVWMLHEATNHDVIIFTLLGCQPCPHYTCCKTKPTLSTLQLLQNQTNPVHTTPAAKPSQPCPQYTCCKTKPTLSAIHLLQSQANPVSTTPAAKPS